MAENGPGEEFVLAAGKVELLLMDCDGVLTDGRLFYSRHGEELKSFHVHDGQGIVRWHAAGFRSGVITGRTSDILEHRTTELGMHFLVQGAEDKLQVLDELLASTKLFADQIAYVGDDVGDGAILKAVGLPVVVANCAEEIRPRGLYLTCKDGGSGAIREVVDLILQAKGLL